ncbi:MAG: PPC domain-containing protein [Promethearchaeota archaeon]
MHKNKFEVLTLFAIFAIAFSSIPMLFLMGNLSVRKTNNSVDEEVSAMPDVPKIEELGTSADMQEQKEIDFIIQNSHNINIPFNIDVFSQYLHTNTQIDVDWKLFLPIDITVNYNNSYYKGDSHDVEIEMSIPDNAAYFQINTTTNFDMSWHLTGVSDGDVSIDNYEWDFQYNFDTPIGKYNLDFLRYKYTVPVSIYGVYIGNFYVELTPQIISTIVAQILSDPNFYDTVKMEWEAEGIKTLSLSARPDASTGQVSVYIGDFEYTISIGIEWAVGFEFVGAFSIIDKILDLMGYDLHWVLGTWPIIKIGSIKSPDQVEMDINIYDIDETGHNLDNAIGIEAVDWWDNQQTIAFPNPYGGVTAYRTWYYKFPVYKNWDYDFEVSSCDAAVEITPSFLDNNGATLVTDSSSGYPKTISYTSGDDSFWYLKLEPDSGTSCNANVEFTNIKWPGISESKPRSLVYPYDGDYWFVTTDNSTAWYTYTGVVGEIVSFWCYEYNENDNLDLELTYLGGTVKSSSTVSGNNESLTYTIPVDGTYMLKVKGTSIENERSYYWLDFGVSDSNGDSINNPDSFSGNVYENSALGVELSTNGGNWVAINCGEETITNITFNGDKWGQYDFELVDSDKSTILNKGTFDGNPVLLSYTCLNGEGGIKYIHILPYEGGFDYNISKATKALYYSGEDREHSLLMGTSFAIEDQLPTAWGTTDFWTKLQAPEDSKLLIKLTTEKGSNFDIYLHKKGRTSAIASKQGDNQEEVLIYDITETNWYNIRVDQVSGTGDYSLTAAIAKEYTEDNFETTFGVENLNQYYWIELDKGETLNIDLEFSGYKSYYVGVIVYDSNYEVVAKETQGDRKSISYTAEGAGIYFIHIDNSKMGYGTIEGDIEVLPAPPETPTIDIIAIIIIAVALFVGVSIVSIIGVRRAKYGEWFWQEEGFKSKFTGIKQKFSGSERKPKLKTKEVLPTKKIKRPKIKSIRRDLESEIIREKSVIDVVEEKAILMEPDFEFGSEEETVEDIKSILKTAQISQSVKDSELWKDIIEGRELSDEDLKKLKDLKLSDKVDDPELWKKFIKDKKEE